MVCSLLTQGKKTWGCYFHYSKILCVLFGRKGKMHFTIGGMSGFCFPTKPMHFSTLCTFFDNIHLFVVLLLVPEDILDGPLCLLSPPDI